jgi:uncharacterized protein (TIGR02246 family)
MPTDNSHITVEARLRAQIEERVKAVGDKNIEALVSSYAPDVLSFDVVNQLQYVGADAIRKRLEEWFASFQGSIGYEVSDLSITAGEAVAFCHFLFRVSGLLKDGGEVGMWVRATVCYRKMDGQWLITHEHDSVPFDTESGKAALDLKP